MKRIADWFRTALAVLGPKWQYAAETLAEIGEFLLLLLMGVLGFVPWLLWRALRRMKKEETANGAAEKPDK